MSESHRDHDKSSNIPSSQNHRNSKDDSEPYKRKRSAHLDINNIDAKVYVRNIPTEKLSDEELLDFFKPYGKVSDIRVFKDHIFVQYNRVDDAKKLINQAKLPLILKGNKIDVLPAREARSTSTKSSSSTDRSSKRTTHRQTSNYEPNRKRFSSNHNSHPDRISKIEIDDRTYNPLLRSNSRQSSNDYQIPYTILTGPKNPNELVDCQIILVNVRQRGYAEEIESRLSCHGLIISTILLREDYTLTEAIENAARLQCLYGIIAMPMHEERRTASFHILYGQTEEHRNLTLEDGIHIIITNYISFKERLHNEEINSYRQNPDPIIYPEPIASSYEYLRQSNNHSEEEITPPILTLGDKLPLSMLLCLLADGRQLTLEEIDRVLVYLLEKKAKMLTLPPGTLPPLPAQYATTAINHQTGSDTRSVSTTDPSPGKSSSIPTEVTSSIAEQIRQILSTNIVKPNSSTVESTSRSSLTKPAIDKLPDIVKVENTVIPQQPKSNIKEAAKEYVQQQQKTQTSFSYPKPEAVSVVQPPFNYTPPSSVSTTGSVNSFGTASLSSFNSVTPSLALNSALKPTTTTSVTVPNFVSQPSQYFYQIPSQNIYQSSLNSAAADTAAAIFQAYSQFNVQPTPTPSIINQQINT